MRKSHIFSARGITQIRNHLSGALFANASAARDRHASARPRSTPESNVFAHSLDLSAVLQSTNGLLMRTGYRIRCSIYHEDRNGNGFLWAVKIGKGNKESRRLVRISRPDIGLALPALRPDNACPDIMEAITGNFSPFSYLEASILKRELKEFGALWHGCDWGTYKILASPHDTRSGMIGGGCPVKWSWISRKIADLRPRVDIKPGQVLVTFYARSDLGSQRIMRFKEIFESDSYVSMSTQVDVAHGGGGYIF